MIEERLHMQDEICPLIKLAEGFSPLDIWQELHANAALWGQENNDIEGRQDRLALSLRMAQRLGGLPASRWLGFNHEIGWGLLAADLIILDQCVANCSGEKSLLRKVWEETFGTSEAW